MAFTLKPKPPSSEVIPRSIRMSKALFARVDELAEELGRPSNEVLVALVEAGLEAYEEGLQKQN